MSATVHDCAHPSCGCSMSSPPVYLMSARSRHAVSRVSSSAVVLGCVLGPSRMATICQRLGSATNSRCYHVICRVHKYHCSREVTDYVRTSDFIIALLAHMLQHGKWHAKCPARASAFRDLPRCVCPGSATWARPPGCRPAARVPAPPSSAPAPPMCRRKRQINATFDSIPSLLHPSQRGR